MLQFPLPDPRGTLDRERTMILRLSLRYSVETYAGDDEGRILPNTRSGQGLRYTGRQKEVLMAQLGFAIVAVSDMNRSIAFYRDLLGLEPAYESPEWTSFGTGATTFALHKAGRGAPPAPGEHPAGTAWMGFTVDDVQRFHEQALARGVRCTQEPRDEGWGVNANYVDPDGFVFSVSKVRHEAGG
jgi:catechol 2,3-dioxygenase-like lactoylglutathione lyase family enzyme